MQMTDEHDPAAAARAIIDDSKYMVLATADRGGQPWASPVWYAPAGYSEFLWVSAPDTTHSRNLEARRELSIVIFDSSTPIGTGVGVYMSAVAEPLAGDEAAEAIDIFSRRSLEQGGHEWTLEDVQGPARLRLYRATAVDQYFGKNDRRVPVSL
jgi:nitroimidazol reductase NimA-like FMN-containing flavoprotein (pyridoxamine 5'-phosphate oxidase superfamily)